MSGQPVQIRDRLASVKSLHEREVLRREGIDRGTRRNGAKGKEGREREKRGREIGRASVEG